MGHILPDPNKLSSVDFVYVVGAGWAGHQLQASYKSLRAKKSRCFKEGRWKIIAAK